MKERYTYGIKGTFQMVREYLMNGRDIDKFRARLLIDVTLSMMEVLESIKCKIMLGSPVNAALMQVETILSVQSETERLNAAPKNAFDCPLLMTEGDDDDTGNKSETDPYGFHFSEDIDGKK
jgi:hypothetical protein